MVTDRTYPNAVQSLLLDLQALLPGVTFGVTEAKFILTEGRSPWFVEVVHGADTTVAVEVHPKDSPTYSFMLVSENTLVGSGYAHGTDSSLLAVCEIADLLRVRRELKVLADRLPEAEQAYWRYGEFVGWKNYVGTMMPLWSNLPSKIKMAWCASLR